MKITEIIPESLLVEEWAETAMAEGNLFNVVLKKLNGYEEIIGLHNKQTTVFLGVLEDNATELAKKDTKIATLEDIIRIAALKIDERDAEIDELVTALIELQSYYEIWDENTESLIAKHKKSPTG